MASNEPATVTVSSARASIHRSVTRGIRNLRSTTRTSGVTTSTPMASPAHHATQTVQNPLVGSLSSSASMAVPTVALTAIPANAPRKTSMTPSRSRSSSGRKPTRRSIRQAQTGASVLPATTAAVDGVTEVLSVAMTSSEPRAIPGQMCGPRISRQPRAIPVGGQSGVTTAPLTVTCLRSPSPPGHVVGGGDCRHAQ